VPQCPGLLASGVMAEKLGPDGHPIPEQQGVVNAVMAPIMPKPKNAGESKTVGVGVALDANGDVIDQTEELKKLIGAEDVK
jgi:hypothetical protein